MTKYLVLFYLAALCSMQFLFAQVVLNADGPGNTYELINSVLAPGFDVTETPDCIHTSFGRHIDEVFDSELNANVFRFHIHVTPDNDRCTSATDRQRNEIKAYDKSPDNLKGVEGETVRYKWKFKLDTGFQSSSSFTHIHQLKSVGGLYEDIPMYTLTTYKGTPDKLALRYAQTNSQTTVKQVDLTPFKGTWVEATETITYGNSGSYSITIKRVSDGTELFSYINSNVINWQTGASFVRPKWGIYRSLNSPQSLRDEQVLFANFSIEENPTLTNSIIDFNNPKIKIYPNPSKNRIIYFDGNLNDNIYSIFIHDSVGKYIKTVNPIKNSIDLSNLSSGLYYLIFNQQSNNSAYKLILN